MFGHALRHFSVHVQVDVLLNCTRQFPQCHSHTIASNMPQRPLLRRCHCVILVTDPY